MDQSHTSSSKENHNESLVIANNRLRSKIPEVSEVSEEKVALLNQFDEREGEIRAFFESSGEFESLKKCLKRVIVNIDRENKIGNWGLEEGINTGVDDEIGDYSILKLASIAESKLNLYKSEKIRAFSENCAEIESIKECLVRMIENIGGEQYLKKNWGTGKEIKFDDFSIGLKEVLNLANTTELMLNQYKEAREKSDKNMNWSENSLNIKSIKECLYRVTEGIGIQDEIFKEIGDFPEGLTDILKLVHVIESEVSEYRDRRDREKRELESSVVSLTEENRDINTLLRVALAEKEAVERSLNRLKGNNEPKRGAIWGLPRVGFGFMMGTSEQASDSSSVKSDSSECEEEVVSLTSTVERIMKNQRLEITQLRRSLEESRSDTERLQSLTEKQAHMIAENEFYIKELEQRQAISAQNVEELLNEIKETEDEVARWREACELEVEAAKRVVQERDKMVFILKQELEKTKAALEIANGKLKLKDELANAAMAAQAAVERSLQLTDTRVLALKEKVEELTKQLEEAENKDKVRRKVRHICWPLLAFKTNRRNGGVGNFKRMLPEMHALLQ